MTEYAQPLESTCCGSTSGPAVRNLRDEQQVREWLRDGSTPDPDDVVALLEERHPVYDGLGSPAIVRIRGALLLALSCSPLSSRALPFILEEIESPHDAYLTAAAAHTLRAAAPDAAFVRPLLDAIGAIRYRDDTVRLSQYGGHGRCGETTTAVAEILETLGWLGGQAKAALEPLQALRDQEPGPSTSAALNRAITRIASAPEPAHSCCSRPTPPDEFPPLDPAELDAVEFEDQDGSRVLFNQYFSGQPSIVVFFYTRCENALKCPVTITKLGVLQRLMREQQMEQVIRTAAITYDPAFDIPSRLEQYRRTWGAERGAGHRMLRTIGDFAPLRAYFQLGVSYGPTVINRHRIEAYVLDSNGRIAHRSTRTQWDEREILARAVALQTNHQR